MNVTITISGRTNRSRPFGVVMTMAPALDFDGVTALRPTLPPEADGMELQVHIEPSERIGAFAVGPCPDDPALRWERDIGPEGRVAAFHVGEAILVYRNDVPL